MQQLYEALVRSRVEHLYRSPQKYISSIRTQTKRLLRYGITPAEFLSVLFAYWTRERCQSFVKMDYPPFTLLGSIQAYALYRDIIEGRRECPTSHDLPLMVRDHLSQAKRTLQKKTLTDAVRRGEIRPELIPFLQPHSIDVTRLTIVQRERLESARSWAKRNRSLRLLISLPFGDQ